MKFFRNLNLNKRIQLFIIPVAVILFSISGLVLYRISAKRIMVSAQIEMSTYLDQLTNTLQLVDEKTGKGFNADDYFYLKPYFNKKAFYESAYPFIFNSSGQYVINILKEGQRLPSQVINQVVTGSEKKGTLIYRDYSNNNKKSILYFRYFEPYNAYMGVSLYQSELFENLTLIRIVLVIEVLILIIIFIISNNLVLNPIVSTIKKINSSIKVLANGESPEKFTVTNRDEIGQINESLSKLIDGLKRTAQFANEIGENRLDTDFETLGENDILGNALLNTRKNLKAALLEESKRKREDEIRSWTTAGLAKFGDILRQNNDNLEKLSDNVIQNLVNYLNANQGGLFIYNDDDPENKILELISSFAYNRKKFIQKQIHINEGLVGTCAIEKQTIYLKEIPADYIKITSGLGDAAPSSLLIVPLKIEESIFGVIEIASFNEFQPYEIEFVERIGESIASTLSAVKNGIRTTQLLEQSQQQREEMAAQEEEMRQNMEEMQATQEEMSRKTIEMEGMTSAINEALLFCELDSDCTIQNPNGNLLAVLGFSRPELEGRNFAEVFKPDERDAFQQNWSSILSGQSYKATMNWIDKNGGDQFILASISIVYDAMGAIYKIFLLGQDVTESKKLELRAQKQSEEIEQNLLEINVEHELSLQREKEMKALLQALDETCIVSEIAPDGLITYINSKNTELFGNKKEEIEGRNLREIDYVALNKPKEFEKFWNSILKGETQNREFSFTKAGRKIWILEHYTPVMNEYGQVVKIINIGFDISEGKNKEEELSRALKELESFKKK